MNFNVDLGGIFNGVVSHAQSLGLFETVNQHEVTSAPTSGLHCEILVDRLGPVVGRSGLNATSGLLVLLARPMTSMIAEPQDDIDPAVLSACGQLMGAFSSDFTLGGLIDSVDLLGLSGTTLSLRAGYIEIDSRKFRVMEVVVPLIINDIWSQSP